MGMVWSARTANERQLQELRANSEVIPNFLNEISEYQNGNAIGLINNGTQIIIFLQDLLAQRTVH